MLSALGMLYQPYLLCPITSYRKKAIILTCLQKEANDTTSRSLLP